MGNIFLAIILVLIEIFIIKKYQQKEAEYGKELSKKEMGIMAAYTYVFSMSTLLATRIFHSAFRSIIVALLLMALCVTLVVTAYMDEKSGHFQFELLLADIVVSIALFVAWLQGRGGFFNTKEIITLLVVLCVIFFLGMFAFSLGDALILANVYIAMFVSYPRISVAAILVALFVAISFTLIRGGKKAIEEKSLKLKMPFTMAISVGAVAGFVVIASALT
ncbi:MAG: hypothetical protein K6D96_03610 [Acetatifactor sp.]|nr:hypothetical protein [Acetatifactor sp.]